VEKSPRGFSAKFGPCRAHPAQDKAGLSQLSSAGAATPWTFFQPIPVVFRFRVCGFNFPFFGKGEQSANKFRKSQIRKFSGLNSLLDLRNISNSGALRICDFGIFFVICELKTFASPQIHTFSAHKCCSNLNLYVKHLQKDDT
jgi:hypothetical protein